VNVTFSCPECACPARVALPGPTEWQCPQCDHLLPLAADAAEVVLSRCAVCGNQELYKKKDFPHWLGLTILTVACLGSVIPYWLYHQWWTWAILIGSAAFDGLLYLAVGDVIVCYRCQAHYRGCRPNPEHKAYELGIAERYRQERLRRERLQAARKPQ
jgi:hypothetical protein